jgi:hypothetical protein
MNPVHYFGGGRLDCAGGYSSAAAAWALTSMPSLTTVKASNKEAEAIVAAVYAAAAVISKFNK